MRIGYSTWGMREVPIEEALPAISRIGYHGVELSVAPGWITELYTLDAAKRERIRELLAEHNLVLAGVIRNVSMVEEDPDRNAANMQSLRDAIDLAAELTQAGEVSVMTSHLGGRSGDWETKRDIAVERLLRLADYAAERGVVIAVEIHCGSMLDSPERVHWLFERVDHPSVRLNFDISHMEVVGIGIDESVPQLAPYSVHTHVKDQRGLYPDFEFLTPGEGPFDFVRYLKAMQAAGYDGFITAEVSVHVQRRADYDPFFHAQLAYWTLYKAFQVAGIEPGKPS
ncbi:MAG: sugar phosphate isomerase/epimerase [Anaerolineales bacterium]|nr:MAG: sugar phosphate isomerase/epimerase [Anaerolineales bacterium]